MGNKLKFWKSEDPFFKFKFLKQITLIGVWVCLGLSGGILGPTLIDLQTRTGTNKEEIAETLIGKNVGSIAGNIFAGFIFEILIKQTDLIMSLSILFMALATAAIPWATSAAVTGIFFSIQGAADGIINTGGNTMIMHLWREKTGPAMSATHFGVGVGAIIAPQLARGFLSPDAAAEDSDDPVTTVASNTTKVIDDGEIEIPYAIVAVFILILAMTMFAFYMKGPPKGFPKRTESKLSPEVLAKMLSPSSCSRGDTFFGSVLFVLLFLYFIQASGGEGAIGKYLFSFAVEGDLEFTKDDASLLQSVFYFAHLTGRFSGIIIAKFVNIKYIVIGDAIGAFATTILLVLYGNQSATALWVLVAVLGFFVSIVYPAGMTWANQYLEMNHMGTMILCIGSSTGGLIYDYVPGILYEDYGPESLLYVELFYGSALLSLVILMTLFVNLRPKRTEKTIDDKFDQSMNEIQIATISQEKGVQI